MKSRKPQQKHTKIYILQSRSQSNLKALRSFPHSAMREAGYQLDKVRHGLPADDAKPMKTIGAGVVELRIWDEAGTFRVVYVAKFEDSFMCCTVFRRRQKRQANGI